MLVLLLLWTPSGVLGLEFEEARHLLARTSFGATLAALEALRPLAYEAAVERVLHGVRAQPRTAPPAWVDEPRPTLLERRTMSESEEVLQEGWLARLFARQKPPPTFAADGIVLGLDPGPLSGRNLRTITMRQPQQFLERASHVQPTTVRTVNPALAHILAIQNEISHAATLLQDTLAGAPEPDASFPATPIGRQLQVVARLLTSRTPVAVLKVSHGSFDTHSNQRDTHSRLLRELAEALVAFRQAMQTTNLWQHVAVMTYAEFGRRVAENGSTGTDHGTAAPHFLLGGRVHGGLYGQQPSLTNLADGDMRHTVDYRSLYMTVARRWWGITGDFLQGRHFPVLDCLA